MVYSRAGPPAPPARTAKLVTSAATRSCPQYSPPLADSPTTGGDEASRRWLRADRAAEAESEESDAVQGSGTACSQGHCAGGQADGGIGAIRALPPPPLLAQE